MRAVQTRCNKAMTRIWRACAPHHADSHGALRHPGLPCLVCRGTVGRGDADKGSTRRKESAINECGGQTARHATTSYFPLEVVSVRADSWRDRDHSAATKNSHRLPRARRHVAAQELSAPGAGAACWSMTRREQRRNSISRPKKPYIIHGWENSTEGAQIGDL